MTANPAYEIIYAPVVRDHLKAIEPKYYSLIRSEIDTQLHFEPEVETRNRKPLKRPVNFGAQWELRLGIGNVFRVFYVVIERQVHILAIGEKKGNQLFVGGKEIE